MNLFSELVNLIIPPKCFICDKKSIRPICVSCVSSFSLTTIYCSRCGKAVARKTDQCSFCREKRFYFDKAFSLGAYEGNLKEVILNLKYDNGLKIAEQLSEIAIGRVDKNLLDIDIVSCIPTTLSKYIKRGYNQSEMLAQNISLKIKKPFKETLYFKKKPKDQMKLNKTLRKENVAGVFGAKGQVEGLSTLLVDDVLTTGATVNECSKVLKKNGAIKVNVLTIGRA